MLALYFIIVGSFALMLIVPVFLLVYLSLEPHLSLRRRLRVSAVPRRDGTTKAQGVQLQGGR